MPDERLMHLEVVDRWTANSYGGDGEARLIKCEPYGMTPQGWSYYGRRHVRLLEDDGTFPARWMHSEMFLIKAPDETPAWIHINNPQPIP